LFCLLDRFNSTSKRAYGKISFNKIPYKCGIELLATLEENKEVHCAIKCARREDCSAFQIVSNLNKRTGCRVFRYATPYPLFDFTKVTTYVVETDRGEL